MNLNAQMDLARLRPVLPGALLTAGALAVWLVGIPWVEDYYARYGQVAVQLESELRQLRADTNTRRDEVRQQTAQGPKYAVLEQEGVIVPQDRLLAARLLEQMRDRHRLTELLYALEPQEVEQDRSLRQGQMEVLTTPIKLSMIAVLDRSIAEVLADIEKEMPGRVLITRLKMEKIANITPMAELEVAGGSPPAFIRAEADLRWSVIRIPEPPQAAR